MSTKLLDLFCGAGGAAEGYRRAGFTEIVGVDIKPQPRYPFDFIQADAFELPIDLSVFDLIHASPPCQAYTSLRKMWNARQYPDLIGPIRNILRATDKPYVIENVPGSPLHNPVILCGTAFGLGFEDADLRRHRLFEIWPPVLVLVPPCQHGYRSRTIGVYGYPGGLNTRARSRVIGVYGGHGRDRRRTVANPQNFPVAARKEAMDIDWMTGAELSQAIPPAYTEWIARRIMGNGN